MLLGDILRVFDGPLRRAARPLIASREPSLSPILSTSSIGLWLT
jgi:hypothetical protein